MKEPLAVTGIGCRFPGGAVSPAAFWRMLCDGTDVVTEVPHDRWPAAMFYAPEPARVGKTYAKWGSFLPQVDQFDAGFFGIPSAEAAAMDPQQRLMLETAWEALEDAGHVPAQGGEKVGVFVGLCAHDYELIQASHQEVSETSPFSATGMAASVVANRVSFCFNFTGPSVVVDTACSSSLVAVHLACRSLWSGECAAALAGGVNCLLSPGNYLAFSSMGILSPSGRCRAFAADADGFVRGEGAGAVVIRPLRDARARGDVIYAVIHATGTNQDGHTPGLPYPSRAAQAALLRATCAEAGVAPHTIAFIEAHGTGTPVGDPIEAGALGDVCGQGRERGRELLIGSVKTNIGHLEGGAGIAGLIKCALSLRHGIMPPSLHCTTPNPAIDFDALRLKVPASLMRLDRRKGVPLVAGVNSFGFGGSNAFVLMGEAPQSQPPRARTSERKDRMWLLPLSARSPEALKASALAFGAVLDEPPQKCTRKEPQLALADIVHTATLRRQHHGRRLVATGQSRHELREALAAYAAGEPHRGIASGEVAARPGPVFVFSGQGAQWHGMGRDLYAHESVFRATMEQCHAALAALGGWSLIDAFLADDARARLGDTGVVQPMLFAIQAALAALWQHWGIEPAAVVGHSVGEVAAAHVAGVLSLEDGMRVIHHRGATMAHVSCSGGMLAVAVGVEQARALIAPHGSAVCIGAVNSPKSVTLSGARDVLDRIAAGLAQAGVWHAFVPVAYAFHGAHMDAVRAPLRAALRGLAPRAARIPLYSTVTGGRIKGTEMDAGYWWQNVRHVVECARAIEAIARDGFTTCVELNAHPVLMPSLQQCLQEAVGEDGWAVLPSLRQHEDGRAVMLHSLATLHCLGCPVRWNRIGTVGTGRHVALPSYPWQRQRYWTESREWQMLKKTGQPHPLLMHRVLAPNPTWLCSADTRLTPYLADHTFQGRPLFPAAAYIEMAVAASRQNAPAAPPSLQDVEIERPFFLTDRGCGAGLRLTVDPQSHAFSIHAAAGDQIDRWQRTVRGMLRPSPAPADTEVPDRVRARCIEHLDATTFYQRAREAGFQFGAMFQSVQSVWRRDGEALARIVLPGRLAAERAGYLMHPVMVDGCLQTALAAADESDPQAPLGAFFPSGFEQFWFAAEFPAQCWAHARVVTQNRFSLVIDLRVMDDHGLLLAAFRRIRYRPVEGVSTADTSVNWFYEHQWQSKPLPHDRRAALHARRTVFLPSVTTVARQVQSSADAARERMQFPRMLHQAGPRLRMIWRDHVVRALVELGMPLRRGATFSLAAAGDRLRVPPHRTALLRACIGMLEAAGTVRPAGREDTWRVTTDVAPHRVRDDMWHDLLVEFPVLSHELLLTLRGGPALATLLRGGTGAALDGLDGLTAQARTQAGTWLPSMLAIRAAVATACRQRPAGRHVTLLDLDVSAGAHAACMLPDLPPRDTRYVLASASSARRAAAEALLQGCPFVEHVVLDIARDPLPHCIAPAAVDIAIVDATVLAAGTCADSLARVRGLMAPGGLLVLVAPDPCAHLHILLARICDCMWQDEIPSAAAIHHTRAAWRSVLHNAGFAEPCTVADTNGRADCGLAVHLACVPSSGDTPAVQPASIPRRSWLVLTDSAGIGRATARRLAADGDTVEVLAASKKPGRLAAALARRYDGIVHLWSIDTPGIHARSVADIRREQWRGTHAVLDIVHACAHLSADAPRPRLWLVTCGAQQADHGREPAAIEQIPLAALARTMVSEHAEFMTRAIDLDPGATAEHNAALLMDQLRHDDGEDTVALRGEARLVPRLVRSSVVDAQGHGDHGLAATLPCRLEIGRTGMLDYLRVRPVARRAPRVHEIEVDVRAAGLNFRDVMKALGVYPGDAADATLLGDEFAGVVVRVGRGVRGMRQGMRVMGVFPGAMASHLTVPSAVVVPIPAALTFEEAATIPVAYLTAHHALEHAARMRKGERVLVHAAAGGVGLAAVRLAQDAGLEVIATAGSAVKHAFLHACGVHHVFSSRTLDFAEQTMAATNGEGVDIVVNSLAGDAMERSLSVLRRDGRFVELGKRDIYGGSAIDLAPFRNCISFAAVDLSAALSPAEAGGRMAAIRRLMARGAVSPLPCRVFMLDNAAAAFRCMAQGAHIGKVVLTMDQAPVVRRAPFSAAKSTLRPDATYLVTGGLRGLGLSLAERMAARGARNLVLTSSSGPASDEAKQGIARLKAQGINVLACKSDVASSAALARLLARIDRTMPPLRGIVHAATAYVHGLLRDATPTAFERVMEVKAYGAWNLHRQTQSRSLDFFVLASSVSAVTGMVGQASYVVANAWCDALAQYRRQQGLPALSLQIDRVRDVGQVARRQDLSDHFARFQWQGITADQVASGMFRMLANNSDVALVCSFSWDATTPGWAALLRQPRFQHVVRAASGATAADGADSIRQRLVGATPAQQHDIVVDLLRRIIADVLRIAPRTIPLDRPLRDVGVDSLMAVELLARIESRLGMTLPLQHISTNPSVAQLAETALAILVGS